MRLKFGKQYKIKWVDAFGESAWTNEEELDKLVELFEQPAQQTLYFIKSSNEFHLFTSGKPEPKRPYIDVHGIPKNWIITIKEVR